MPSGFCSLGGEQGPRSSASIYNQSAGCRDFRGEIRPGGEGGRVLLRSAAFLATYHATASSLLPHLLCPATGNCLARAESDRRKSPPTRGSDPAAGTPLGCAQPHASHRSIGF